MVTAHPIPTHARFQNLTGRKYGRLTVVSFAGKRLGRSTWNCVCDCGKETVVFAQPLKEGVTTSCGCVFRERLIARSTKHGHSRVGLKTAEYRAWTAMKRRCYNPRTKDYPDYGGRGIKVCDRWRDSFEAFLADMGEKPSPRHTLDRFPDVNGDYEPDNCRWATPKEQARNARSNVVVTYRGRQLCLGELAELTGMDYFVLHSRIRDGWEVERAVVMPTRRR